MKLVFEDGDYKKVNFKYINDYGQVRFLFKLIGRNIYARIDGDTMTIITEY